MALLRRYSSRQNQGVLSELNVTPLLDLAFVLLVIFMITAPLLRQGMELVLPTTKTDQEVTLQEDLVSLAVNKQGKLSLNGVPVEENTLASSLSVLKQQRETLAVVVEADQSLPVQRLVELLELVKTSGITRMGIVTRKEVPAHE